MCTRMGWVVIIAYKYLYSSRTYYFNLYISLSFGFCVCMVGFCMMHDASHYGIFHSADWNEWASHLSIGCLWWSQKSWKMHHVFRHHAYTNHENHDPDVFNLRPFFRKDLKESKSKYLPYFGGLYLFTFLIVFPGSWFGQVLQYINWCWRGYIWKMPYKRGQRHSTTSWFVNILKIYIVVAHGVLWNRRLPEAILYIITINFWYTCCMIPDHDTYESHKKWTGTKK
eukprot:UN31521